jgi:hypothetical protein
MLASRAFLPLALVLAFSAAACGSVTVAEQRDAVRVRALTPKPVVDMPKRAYALELAIDHSVPDRFEYQEPDWRTGIPVEDWHASLRNAHAAGPGRSFADGPAKARLVITNAELTWVTSAVFTRGASVMGPAAMHARVKYTARLEAPDGQVLGRQAGEVFSSSPWVDKGGTTTTAQEAVAGMFEEISVKLLAPWADANP